MKNDDVADSYEGTPMPHQKQKENGEDLRLQIVLSLVGGGTRKRMATITLVALTETEQERVNADVQSLLAGWARKAISEMEGRHDVQL